jgi:hypothetical protein
VAGSFLGVAGVVEVVRTVDGVELIVEGPVGAAHPAPAALDVVRIRSDDGEDMEDVFLGFYRGGDEQ